MSLIKAQDQEYLKNEFKAITQPVTLMMFTQTHECQFCQDTRQIAEELSELSDQITLEVYDFLEDPDMVQQYSIDKIPALVVAKGGGSPKDYNIRYYGIPSGYEFSSLIQDILMVGTGESGLSTEAKAWAASLTEPVHMQVFVTPTCPYCPPAVRLAHQFAMESDLIKGDMIEATEFPHLAMKYQVMGVPRTVINEDTFVEGAMPEAALLNKLKAALR